MWSITAFSIMCLLWNSKVSGMPNPQYIGQQPEPFRQLLPGGIGGGSIPPPSISQGYLPPSTHGLTSLSLSTEAPQQTTDESTPPFVAFAFGLEVMDCTGDCNVRSGGGICSPDVQCCASKFGGGEEFFRCAQ